MFARAQPRNGRGLPTGWFRALASDRLRARRARTAQINGRQLVFYRTASGIPRLVRPSWPVCDWNGQLMVFVAAETRHAPWPLPSLPQTGWSRPVFRTLRLEGHVQDVAENGVDLGHFGVVHQYSRVRDPQVSVNGVRLHSRFAFDRKSPLGVGVVSSVFDTDLYGLGCSVTDLRVQPWGLHARLLLLATQVDPARFDFTIAVQLDYPAAVRGWGELGERLRECGASLLSRGLLVGIVHDVLQDREIWAHRAHLEHPALAQGDGPIGLFRRYARQFYPEGESC